MMFGKLWNLVLVLLVVADLWFFFMIRAVFYSPERAFELASAKLPDVVADTVNAGRVHGDVLYNGRSLLERIMDIPSIYSGGHASYAVHEFVWRYDYVAGEQYISIGLAPNGSLAWSDYLPESPVGKLVPYAVPVKED